MVVGDNGVLTQAQKASIETNIESEKEAIEFNLVDITADLIEGKEVAKEKYMGYELSEMKSAVEGDWKNVIVGDKIYKDGWYLLEKGKEISNYGEAKNNWLINYNTGEIINLEEENYTIASASASGAIVDETLKLNIDPSNLKDREKWGSGVSFHGDDSIDNNGIDGTELVFDGEDDYLEVQGVNLDESVGITFEFYGNPKLTTVYALSRLKTDDNGIIEKGNESSCRLRFSNSGLNCCLGTRRCWFGS